MDPTQVCHRCLLRHLLQTETFLMPLLLGFTRRQIRAASPWSPSPQTQSEEDSSTLGSSPSPCPRHPPRKQALWLPMRWQCREGVRGP